MAAESNSTSRRAVVTGLAAAPVMALPAVAASIAPDPVFAALEAERAARERHVAQSAAQDVAENEWEAVKHLFPDHIEVPISINGQESVRRLESANDIDRFVARWLVDVAFCDESVHDAFDYHGTRDDLLNRLAEIKARRGAEYNRRGLRDMDLLSDRTHSAWWEAEKAALRTHPTTLRGAIAKLAFIREYIERGGEGELEPAVAGIETFLAEQAAQGGFA